MREPGLVEAAEFSPGHCFVCGGNEGPFIDTRVDVLGDGRFYLCVKTCLAMSGRLAGYLPPEDADKLTTRLAVAAEREAELEQELAFERDHKTVSISELLAAKNSTPTKAKAA